jgi:UDP-N-acetylmuramoyl-tripeptide--D-alanyl-D-alanine ligase
MHAAIDTVKSLKIDGRKIAVLGDMLEIGKYTLDVHEEIGHRVAQVFDFLITVGPRAKFIAEGANQNGMKKKNIESFDTADEAKLKVQEILKKGDVILIKGSRAMELDKVVEEIRQV